MLGYRPELDPLILKKLTNKRMKKQLVLGVPPICPEEDIWSLGYICYEMLIGRPVFDTEDMLELIENIKKGDYCVPTNLSMEVISFLNGIFQNYPFIRMSTEQLFHHRFLTDNINNFHKIDLKQVSDKIEKGKMEINTKENESIWSIFNTEEELKK